MTTGAKAPSTPRPKVQKAKTWMLMSGDREIGFVQKELTFFGKNDLMGLVGDAISTSLEKGVDLPRLLASIDIGKEAFEDLRAGKKDIGALMATTNIATAVLKVFSTVPSLLPDAYLIILGVDPEDWDVMRRVVRRIDDKTGFGIFKLFVEQNGETLKDFVIAWWETLQASTQTLTNQSDSSALSSV